MSKDQVYALTPFGVEAVIANNTNAMRAPQLQSLHFGRPLVPDLNNVSNSNSITAKQWA